MTDREAGGGGREMKGNLIDEKEEQEKGVAVRERSTSESEKCRAGPSQRQAGISGASFEDRKLEMQPPKFENVMRSLCEH